MTKALTKVFGDKWIRQPVLGFDNTPGPVRLRTLIALRWVALMGQTATLIYVHYGLGFRLPIQLALGVVVVTALMHVLSAILLPVKRGRVSGFEASWFLAYDILQLSALLYLTGGLKNPFAVLILAPVTVSATILSQASTVRLSLLATGLISFLAFYHEPLPWKGPGPVLPDMYLIGLWAGLMVALVFITVYVWQVSHDALRLSEALTATRMALAREQRVSALGALAAAAAHELGSPLSTISVVAKELLNDLPDGSPHRTDAELLMSQSERCRTILADLSQHPEAEGGEPFRRLPLSALVEEAARPHCEQHPTIQVDFTLTVENSDSPAKDEPLVSRSSAILHGLGNLLQNAIQFADTKVQIGVIWTNRLCSVEIRDDGPGFTQQALTLLGEPYVSSRAGRNGHMGLGVFIAKTLLGQTGARLRFQNALPSGAHVTVTWARPRIEQEEGDGDNA